MEGTPCDVITEVEGLSLTGNGKITLREMAFNLEVLKDLDSI